MDDTLCDFCNDFSDQSIYCTGHIYNLFVLHEQSEYESWVLLIDKMPCHIDDTWNFLCFYEQFLYANSVVLTE